MSVIALWLGHEQTETAGIYLHADLALKEKALSRTTPPGASPGRYQPTRPAPEVLTRLRLLGGNPAGWTTAPLG